MKEMNFQISFNFKNYYGNTKQKVLDFLMLNSLVNNSFIHAFTSVGSYLFRFKKLLKNYKIRKT